MLERIGFATLDLPSLRTLTQAGGRMSDAMILRFHEAAAAKGARLVVMYGQTEATARIAYLPPERLPEKLGSAGIAIPDGRLWVEEAGEGVAGEVLYAGPNVMLGYAASRADLAEGDTLGGVLRTGDLGRIDADGFLWLSGRSKRIAKVFGLRLNLDEVEQMLHHLGPTAVVGGDDRLVIFCAHGDEERFGGYRASLSKALRLNHRALEFRRVDAIPATPSGKTDYSLLRDQV
jgi:acyl-CoA synthetase (AMP-forming)/AMP-acid ligase II